MGDPDLLYDADFSAWTKDQAEALRNAARIEIPEGYDRGLDWHNLADEIESLGMSERAALQSQVRRVLHHLMKLEFSSAEGPRNGWRQSVRGARVAIEDILERNPSLRPTFAAVVFAETSRASKLALGDLEDHGEADAAAHLRRAARDYHPLTEVLADWLPEGPAHR